jgi:hypothetical protein
MWQAGISFNCDNRPSPLCPGPQGEPEFGGFWGWVAFDRSGTQTWGDAQLTGRELPRHDRHDDERPRVPRRLKHPNRAGPLLVPSGARRLRKRPGGAPARYVTSSSARARAKAPRVDPNHQGAQALPARPVCTKLHPALCDRASSVKSSLRGYSDET